MKEKKDEMGRLAFWRLFARIIVFLVFEAVLVWKVASLPWCSLRGLATVASVARATEEGGSGR